MAIEIIPQGVDFKLEFKNVTANISPTTIDLTSLDDIVLTISYNDPTSDLVVELLYTTSPSAFTIDDTNKKITVNVTSADLGTTCGLYYVNLWLIEDSKPLTHRSKLFELEQAVQRS